MKTSPTHSSSTQADELPHLAAAGKPCGTFLLLLGTLLLFILPLGGCWAWNGIIPQATSLPPITYRTSLGLSILCGALHIATRSLLISARRR